MKIYIDVLFFINFISTYLLLDITVKLSGNKVKSSRKLIGALLGAALSVSIFLLKEIGFLIRILSFIIIPMCVFGFNKSYILKHIIFFLISSLIMSAVFVFIEGFYGSNVYVRQGVIYFDIQVKRFIVIFLISYLAVKISAKLIKKRNQKKIVKIKILFNGESVELKALSDSGNLLKEPISKKSVTVSEWETVKKLFNNISYEDFKSNIYKFNLRIIPYKTIDKKSGVMYAFLSDDMILKEEKIHIEPQYIAITTAKLSSNKEYDALIGILDI